MITKIYLNSPYFIKCVLASLKGYLNKSKRYNRFYNKKLKELLLNKDSDYDFMINYQKIKLTQLLIECFLFSKYYNNLFLSNNISIDDIKKNPYEALYSLPILSKKERKEYVDEIINNNKSRKVSTIGFTSGTTGTPTKNVLDYESEAMSFALWNRFHIMIGLNKKERNVRFSSNIIIKPQNKRPPFWVYNKTDDQLIMSVFHLKESYLESYIDKLNSFEPIYLDGFPSAIYIVSEYINRKNIKLNFKPIAICTTAETLFEFQREEIEKAFNCKVFNQYASSEGSPFITECKYGNMHLNEDSGVFEILDENNKPVNKGEVGRLVVTSLRNWKTPLLRYDILDYVETVSNDSKCLCNSPFKHVKSVLGRSNDMLWTFERGYVSGGIASVIKEVNGIDQLQIVQIDPNKLVVKIVKNTKFSVESENNISKKLKNILGDKISIKFEYKKVIDHNKSGKLKLLIRDFDVIDYISKVN
ncbi:phenylacetate--CoA ligase family protein [Empedobacter sp. 225-1]|uniref:phenylacetate--CoA ligase family protein n=1 Tax=Empedobacter sp. 225-1 TaxID=2746725 RepID=UPI0025765307|nr:hypothetical protein [Empedobacter sp. 225-1]MDM1522305.1 phenylacetate--CoA ligase family protein [Empedobacter sp. 225-1]